MSIEQIDRVRRRRRLVAAILLPAVVLAAIALALVSQFSGGGQTATLPEADPARLTEDLAVARQALNEMKPAKAEAVLRKTAAAFPEDQDVRTLLAEALLGMGEREEAHRQFERAIAIGPDNAELRHAAGTVANTAGLVDRAEEHFWRAQQLDPQNPKHPLYLGLIQRKLGKTAEAKKNLMIAAQLEPSLAEAWGALAAIGLDENRLSIALGHIRRARAADPPNLNWRTLEAKILRRDNKPEQAARLLIALDDETILTNAAVREELAITLGMLDRADEAAAIYAEAVEQAPDDPDLLHETALWYERAGQEDVAATYARRAARLGMAEAEATLARLEEREGS